MNSLANKHVLSSLIVSYQQCSTSSLVFLYIYINKYSTCQNQCPGHFLIDCATGLWTNIFQIVGQSLFGSSRQKLMSDLPLTFSDFIMSGVTSGANKFLLSSQHHRTFFDFQHFWYEQNVYGNTAHWQLPRSDNKSVISKETSFVCFKFTRYMVRLSLFFPPTLYCWVIPGSTCIPWICDTFRRANHLLSNNSAGVQGLH